MAVFREPQPLFHGRERDIGRGEQLGAFSGAGRGAQLGEVAARLDEESLRVQFFVRRVQRPALDPAVANARVLDEAVGVGVGGGVEGVGALGGGVELGEERVVADLVVDVRSASARRRS